MVNTIRTSRWFSIFLIIHMIVWTLAPALVRFNLPLDAMEGSTWGHQLEWGYDKNPFMNGWLTALAVKLDGMSGWATYFFSQLSVAIALWALWTLGKKILPPLHALVAVLLLEGIQYFNLHAIDFNDNTLEMGLWALTILFFYDALQKPLWRNWILTGLFAGLSMMTKYYMVMLLVPMGLYLLIYPENRLQFRKASFYGGVITFLAVVLPHFLWLFSHEFITVQYAVGRVSLPPSAWNHIFFPAQFAWQQLEVFLPVLILSLIILIRQSKVRQPISVSLSDKRFLIFMGLGPFLLTILLSAIMGLKLRAGWGQPLLSLWTLMLIAALQPSLTARRFYQFFAIIIMATILLVATYSAALIRADEPSSANYPGKIIASQLTQEWQKKYNMPLTTIAGPRWLAGNIAFYSSEHPAVYIDFDKQLSPWIDENKLKQTGAIFVWDLTESDQVSFEQVKQRFPTITKPKTLTFAWMRNSKMTPVTIQVAFLPPQCCNK